MKTRSLAILVHLACLTATATAHAEKSLAERLGYSSQDKILIVHADDLGMSHSANRASIDAFRYGLVKTGSVMMPCPWVPEIVEFASKSDVDLGIHVTLTSEWKNFKWRPLSVLGGSGLTNPAGYFWPSQRDLVKSATAEEVEREIEAQVQQALSIGLKPTHLDSHMGAHFAKPEYIKAMLSVAKKFKIPPMLVRWSSNFETELNSRGLPTKAIRQITEEAQKEGLVMLDQIVTRVEGRTIHQRRKSFETTLKNLKPGITQIIVHLGFHDDEIKGIMVGAKEGEYRRYADYLFFTDPVAAKLVKTLGIKVIGWRELKATLWKD